MNYCPCTVGLTGPGHEGTELFKMASKAKHSRPEKGLFFKENVVCVKAERIQTKTEKVDTETIEVSKKEFKLNFVSF